MGSGREATLLDRTGDLKGELVDYARSPRWSRHLEAAMRKRFGTTDVSDDRELINFLDYFVLQHRLPSRRTLVESFVESSPDLSQTEREMLLSWQDVVEGIFEVRGRDGDTISTVNVIDEMPYRLYSNMGQPMLRRFVPKSFVVARVVPLGEDWLLSGAQSTLPKSAKAEVLRVAAQQTIDNPELAFRNPEKITRGWELQRWERERFIEYFGHDLVKLPGPELAGRMRAFYEWRVALSADSRSAKQRKRRKQPPLDELTSFPESLTGADQVAVVYDEEEGLSYFSEYGLVEAAFWDPDLATDRRHPRAVLRYLRDDSVSTLPFRRLARRDTEKASRLFQRLLKRPSFSWSRDGDALLRKHKPTCFDREPRPRITPLSERLAAHMPASG